MTQLGLGIAPRRTALVAPRRLDPAIWVRRLRLVRKLSPDLEHIIRDVELRRGLNIIWAPPHAEHATALFKTGITGHTAGKTSFCRLIRYALGERHFANEQTRHIIRAKLPDAWLLAEVVVDGRSWAVARPLGHNGKSFCMPDAEISELTSGERPGGLTQYLNAIAQATTTRLPATRFPGNDEAIIWDHLLPWLTRDQECRFADFAVWRHATSASDAPQLTSEERHFVIRSALALVSDAERDEQHRNAILLTRKKRLADRIPLLRHQAEVDEKRLGELLEMSGLLAAGLVEEGIRSEISRSRMSVQRQREEFLARDPRQQAQAKSERAAVAVETARRDLKDLEDRLQGERIYLETLDADHQGEEQRQLLQEMDPLRYYCNVPLELAAQEGCPLFSRRPINFLAAKGERSLGELRRVAEQLVTTLELQRPEKQAAVELAKQLHAEALRELVRVQTNFNGELSRLSKEDFRLREAERLLENAAQSRREADKAEQEIRLLGEEIERSYILQAAHRDQRRSEYAHVSAAFETIIQALLGADVQAVVETAGRSLDLHVVRDGRRDSAAITTVKLLAFDLAALVTSVAGQGEFPRFLVHDGPREADLAPDIYERLFLYIMELEKSFEGEPPFQYVVTTTTEPPAAVVCQPWVRLRLAGTQAENRLYAMDF